MLFMAIFSYVPEDRDTVIERRSEKLDEIAGIELKGEWFDVTGHRVFRLFETEDEMRLAASVFQWSDLGVAEVVPVMDTTKALKFMKKLTRK